MLTDVCSKKTDEGFTVADVVNNDDDFNILDKQDKSSTSMPNGALGPVKREKHDWSETGKEGHIEWIDKTLLNIDSRYQRDAVSDQKVLSIARQWNWVVLGVIIVARRSNGSYWVMDGGHRTRASFYRDDVKMLPCLVHQFVGPNETPATLDQEANAFVGINTTKAHVSARDRYKAAVVGNDDVAVEVKKILDDCGLRVTKSGAVTKDQISCISTLWSMVKDNPEDAGKVLKFCIQLSGEMPVTAVVLSSLFVLYSHFKPQFDIIDKCGERLMKRNDVRSLDKIISCFAIECDSKKQHGVIGAKAILRVINHRVKTNVIEW